ncbi:hypothetical protein V5799_026512 [Amblyomma americanum]|uniref:Uncharacterized protein n=1 Tax=Amblyomma americanum TaxID=6943 RepID=A0AAQ4DID2_AMBAM
MLTGAWWSVTSTTIQNCWKKAGLTITDGQPQTDEPAAEDSSSKLLSEVAEQLAVDPSVTFDDYVQCDKATWTSVQLTTDDMLQSVQGPGTQDEECSDDMDDDVTAAPEDCDESVSATNALNCLRKLRIFIAKSGTATEGVHKNADGLESFVLQSLCCTCQKTITAISNKCALSDDHVCIV